VSNGYRRHTQGQAQSVAISRGGWVTHPQAWSDRNRRPPRYRARRLDPWTAGRLLCERCRWGQRDREGPRGRSLSMPFGKLRQRDCDRPEM